MFSACASPLNLILILQTRDLIIYYFTTAPMIVAAASRCLISRSCFEGLATVDLPTVPREETPNTTAVRLRIPKYHSRWDPKDTAEYHSQSMFRKQPLFHRTYAAHADKTATILNPVPTSSPGKRLDVFALWIN